MRVAEPVLTLLLASCATAPPEEWPAASPSLPAAWAPDHAVAVDEAAAFAVAHHPHLVALRASLGVSDAAVVAAGVWPDPGISASVAVPLSGSESVGVDGGIHWQLSSLWTRDAVVDAAAATASGAREQARWEEQAVVADVRLQASRLWSAGEKRAVVAAAIDDAAGLVDEAGAAVARGDVVVDVLTLRQLALQDARARAVDVDRDADVARRALCFDLGLAPGCTVALAAPGPAPSSFSSSPLEQLLQTALRERRDLRALRAAWQSNEATLRAAALAQFPDVDVSVGGGHDTGGFVFGGGGVEISVPVFDGGRGDRAVAVATRAQLKAELDERTAEIARDLGDALAVVAFAARERALLSEVVPALEQSDAALREARGRGDATAAAWSEARGKLVDARLRLIDVEQAAREACIALEASAGLTPPRSAP